MPDGNQRRSLAENDATLIKNGYAPVPLDGKVPVGDEWNTQPNTVEAIAARRSAFPSATNTGARAGDFCPVDIDITPAEHAEAVKALIMDRLGHTSVERVGSKGMALCYYNPTPIGKIRVKCVHSTLTRTGKDGKLEPLPGMIEFLGVGQQLAIYGTHPDTGKQYDWPNADLGAEPLWTPLASLPLTSPDALRALALSSELKGLLEELGYRNVTVSGPGLGEQSERTASSAAGAPVSEEHLRLILGWLNAGDARDNWRDIVAAIRATPIPNDEDESKRRLIAHEFSRGELDRAGRYKDALPANYDGDEAVDQVFDTMPPKDNGVGYGTIFKLARDAGYGNGPARQSGADTFSYDVSASLSTDDGAPVEPFDLFGDLKLMPSPEMTRAMLPSVIGGFAADVALRGGGNLAIVAVPALVVCASALDDRIMIQPKVHDTRWKESTRLWAAVVAPSGTMKSSAIKEATTPLREVEERWQKEDDAKFARYEATEEYRKKQLSDHRGMVKALGDDATVTTSGTCPAAAQKPERRRLIVGDVTMEGLAYILKDNLRGILSERDELVEFFAGFDAYRNGGAGKDRSAALQLYEGGPRTVDRATAGKSIAAPNWSMCQIGGIQPDRLRELLQKSKLASDGLLQRYMLAGGVALEANEDRPPDIVAIGAYAAVVKGLLSIQPGIPAKVITLSEGAQQYRLEVEHLYRAVASLPSSNPALQSHLAKGGRGLFARLLLTFHAVECVAERGHVAFEGLELVVRPETARRVRDFMVHYLLPYAVQFYDEFFRDNDAEGERVRDVAGYILAHKVESITRRDITRNWHEDPGAAERVMDALVRAGWAFSPTTEGQRQMLTWGINPLVHSRFAKRAAEEKSRREREHAALKENVATVRKAYQR